MSTLRIANMNPFEGLDNIVTENVPLAPHTWYKIGGPARYFATPRDEGELGEVLRRAGEAELPVQFRLDRYQATREPRLLLAVQTTLDKMAQGGVYDQLAGGFHRYSVDERWCVPHFEKMSYDNSELLKNYLHGWQSLRLPHTHRQHRCR